jgi:hypothetical protein
VLLRVAVEAGAISGWGESLTREEAVQDQRALVNFLMQRGAMYFGSEREAAEFMLEARRCAPGSQLASVWAAGYGVMRDARWRVSSDGVDLQLAPPNARVRQRQAGGPERTKISRYMSSDAVQRINDLSSAGLAAARTSREDVWVDWLAPLAEHYREVTVFDPYLGAWLGTPEKAVAQHGIAACMWLVERLAGLRGPHQLTFVTVTRTQDPATLAEALSSRISLPTRSGLTKVAIVVAARGGAQGALARAKSMQREIHDRHIRFSGGSRIESAILVSTGIDRLGLDPMVSDVHLQFRSEFGSKHANSLENLRATERAVIEAEPGVRVEIRSRRKH